MRAKYEKIEYLFAEQWKASNEKTEKDQRKRELSITKLISTTQLKNCLGFILRFLFIYSKNDNKKNEQ